MAARRTWQSAAELVLAESERPLESREIAEIAFAQGLIVRRGSTPEYSVQAAISRDLKSGRRGNSPFVVYGTGQQRRRYWLREKTDSGT